MNMRSIVSTLLAAGLISTASAEQPLYPAIKGDLVSLQGKNLHRAADAPLAGAKYFAIYYSASWCGPCKAFTPKLVEFYNKIKPANPGFELIFFSDDNSEKEMEAYMKADNMPWPALAYNKLKSKKQLAAYAGPGIPCLVFLDANGKVLSDSYVGGNYVGPAKVMADIESTLKASPSDAKTTGAAKPAAVPGSNSDNFVKK